MADYKITLSVDDYAEATLAVDDDVGMNLALSDPYINGGRPYEGEYEVTPTQYEQVLPTQGRSMSQNVTIHPIPSCYGLITWNGSKLKVS